MAKKSKVIFKTVTKFTITIKTIFGDPDETKQAEKHLFSLY